MPVAASLALILGSSLLAATLPTQVSFRLADDNCTSATTPTAEKTYYGRDQPEKPGLPTRLRISNGGAGLSGLVGHLADEFISSELKNNASLDRFKVGLITVVVVISVTNVVEPSFRLNGLRAILPRPFSTWRLARQTSESRTTRRRNARQCQTGWQFVESMDSVITFTLLVHRERSLSLELTRSVPNLSILVATTPPTCRG